MRSVTWNHSGERLFLSLHLPVYLSICHVFTLLSLLPLHIHTHTVHLRTYTHVHTPTHTHTHTHTQTHTHTHTTDMHINSHSRRNLFYRVFEMDQAYIPPHPSCKLSSPSPSLPLSQQSWKEQFSVMVCTHARTHTHTHTHVHTHTYSHIHVCVHATAMLNKIVMNQI